MRSQVTSIFFAFLLICFSACDEQEAVIPQTNITIEGKEYQTIKIGDQTWTSENYAGPGGVSFDPTNTKPEYGKYYSKAELSSITLPDGWRIPTQDDYKKLAQSHGITLPSHGTNTNEIKALISKTDWNNVIGTNASGFNALPAGYIFGDAAPRDGDVSEFWTSEGITLSIQEAGANLTSLRMVFYQSDNSPDFKFNVRFVKD